MSKADLTVFQKSHLPGLDGLRFFAVMLVLLSHAGVSVNAGDGVSYFFVLSGLLFCWLFGREWEKSQHLNIGKFYLRRVFRIVPAFYTAVLFTILAKKALHLPIDFHHALSAIAYYANYYNAFHGHPETGFDFYWSLSVEEQFYLVWPLFFTFFMAKSRSALIKFLALSILVVCAWRSYLFFLRGASHAYLYNAFDTRFDSLAMGCLLGMLITSKSFVPFMQKICKTGYEPILVLIAIHFAGVASESFYYSIGFTVQSALMAIFILQMVLLHRHFLWSWLNHPLCGFLGTLSYSMYLFHGWGIAIGHRMHFLPFGLQVLVGVLGTIALAALCYYGVEKPFLRIRKNLEART